MHTISETNDALADFVIDAADGFRKRIIGHRADGDWPPLLVVQHPGGNIAVPPIPADMLGSDAEKDALARTIGDLVSHEYVDRAALLLSSWTTTIKPNADGSPVDIADRPRPRDAADRREVLVLHVTDRTGSELSMLTEIHRLADTPPILGEWERAADQVRTEGRFPDAMRRVCESKTTDDILGPELGLLSRIIAGRLVGDA